MLHWAKIAIVADWTTQTNKNNIDGGCCCCSCRTSTRIRAGLGKPSTVSMLLIVPPWLVRPLLSTSIPSHVLSMLLPKAKWWDPSLNRHRCCCCCCCCYYCCYCCWCIEQSVPKGRQQGPALQRRIDEVLW